MITYFRSHFSCHLLQRSRLGTFTERKIRSMVASTCWKGEWGSQMLMGTGFVLGSENVLNLGDGHGLQLLELNETNDKLYTLKQ